MSILARTLLLAGLAGCALTTKSAPIDVRYFDPATIAVERTPRERGDIKLRLGRITASAHLRYRIVKRISPIELHAYDSLRWTEYPERYVRRAVAQALFADRGVDEIVGGPGPVLDVEVLAFEQASSPAGDTGRIELRYQLHDGRAVLTAGSIRVERPAAAPGIDSVVGAIGAALDAAAAELADRVDARFAARP